MALPVASPLRVALFVLVVAGCSGSAASGPGAPATEACSRDADCSGETPRCDSASRKCVAPPPAHELGTGDGSASSVTFTEIYKATPAAELVDVAFDPDHEGWLWAVGYGDDSTHIGQGIGGDAPTWERLVDPAAMHFMHRPPALAMGGGLRWATCGDNDNSQNPGADLFMGPALFETDLSVFAKPTPEGRGSHTDMLHNTPFCRGIAHEAALVYWVFNSFDKSIDKYDFGKEHEPGGDDHSAGSIYRYVKGQVLGKDGVSSHLAFDASDATLYIADTGHHRIVKLDTTKGTRGAKLARQFEPLKDDALMTGATLEEVVAPGVLDQPSGVEVRGDFVYVTDTATGTFYAFDKQGGEVRRLATGLPPGALSGFTFGPDGRAYFTDRKSGRVLRIDPR